MQRILKGRTVGRSCWEAKDRRMTMKGRDPPALIFDFCNIISISCPFTLSPVAYNNATLPVNSIRCWEGHLTPFVLHLAAPPN